MFYFKKLLYISFIAIYYIILAAVLPAFAGEEIKTEMHIPSQQSIKSQSNITSEDEDNLATATKLVLTKIELEGNKIFTNEQLQPILETYLNKTINAEDLQQLRRDLTAYYVNRGYINSGAIIPSQNLVNGAIRIQIIEGQLTKLQINGLYWLNQSYLYHRLSHFVDGKQAFNINALQQKLRLLEQDPVIERLHAEIEPESELGKARLKLRVEEAQPWGVSLSYNNHMSPNVGSKQDQLDLVHKDLFGFGDKINLSYQQTEGIKAHKIGYIFPISADDTKLWFSYDKNAAKVVAKPFNLLNIQSFSKNHEVGVRRPFYKTLDTDFNLSLSLRKKANELFLLGEPFSFIPTEQEGKNSVSVLTFGQEWVKRSLSRVLAIYSNFDFGLRAFHASSLPEPDGKYQAWLGQFQLLQSINYLKSSLLLRTNLRLSDDKLLSFEKFSLGGSDSVRGYRESQITRDNGLFTSVEWRIPIGKISVPLLSKGLTDGKLQLIPFFDYGRGWETKGGTPEPKDIMSLGMGFHWTPGSCCEMGLYFAKALTKIDLGKVERDLQDSGIHFSLNINF